MLKKIVLLSSLMMTGIVFGGQGFRKYGRLPQDMQLTVIRHMHPQSVMNMSLTNKQQRRMVKEAFSSLMNIRGVAFVTPREFKRFKTDTTVSQIRVARRLDMEEGDQEMGDEQNNRMRPLRLTFQ